MAYTDTELEAFDNMERAFHARQADKHAKLLRKLNQKELFVLAKHYSIAHPEDYAEGWSKGGKDELVREIADLMVNE